MRAILKAVSDDYVASRWSVSKTAYNITKLSYRVEGRVTDKLPTEQSGFRKHHSTNDKLFELTQAFCQTQRLYRRVGAIFLDIEKAFESGTMAYVTNCYT